MDLRSFAVKSCPCGGMELRSLGGGLQAWRDRALEARYTCVDLEAYPGVVPQVRRHGGVELGRHAAGVQT